MKTKTISLMLLLTTLAGCAFGQSAPKPLTQAEILGRLAVGYSPSYVARLVKSRGIHFSPSEGFLSAVRSAGGEGILVEHLSSAETSAPLHSFSDAERPTVDLARCAELLRSGAMESAESDCRAAIEENPQSPWPWIAALHVFDVTGVASEERVALLDRCAMAGSEFATTHGALSVEELTPEARREAIVKILREIAGSSDEAEGYLYTSQNEADYRDLPELESFSPEAEAQPRSEMEKMLEAARDLARSHVVAAHFFQSLGEVSRGQGELREALRLEPGNAGIHYALGHFYRSQHRVEEELSEFREAARLVPYGALERQALADSLVREGRIDEAIADWRDLVALSPKNLRASNALVQLYLRQKDRQSAIAELHRSLKVSQESSRDEAAYANSRFQDIDQLAQLLSEDRDYEAAARLYEFQLRFLPESASLRNSYGNALFAMRRFAEAAGEYRAALQGQPELSLVHRNLGICLAAEKNLDGAIAEYRQAEETDPEDRSIPILLGDALVKKGDLNGAMEQFREAIARTPGDPAARTHLAHAFFANNDAASAVGELMGALELKPDFPEAENELARVYATSSDPHYRNAAAALSAARKAVQSSSEPIPTYLDTLAEALFLNGQPVEAMEAEERAAKLAGDDPDFQSQLSRFRQAALSVSTTRP